MSELVPAAYLDSITTMARHGLRSLGELGEVYVFKGVRYVKVGYSKNAEGRMRTLQEHVPFRLELLHKLPGGYPTERAIQLALVDYRSRGDWFHFNSYVSDGVYALRKITQKQIKEAFRVGVVEKRERSQISKSGQESGSYEADFYGKA